VYTKFVSVEGAQSPVVTIVAATPTTIRFTADPLPSTSQAAHQQQPTAATGAGAGDDAQQQPAEGFHDDRKNFRPHFFVFFSSYFRSQSISQFILNFQLIIL
jgi:hypothetical protein